MGRESADFQRVTRHALDQIASDVRLVGSRLFQIADALPEMVSSEVTSFPDEPGEDALVRSLIEPLYLRYYCGLISPIRNKGMDLGDVLRRANASADGWDGGWEVLGHAVDGKVVIRKGTRTQVAAREDLGDAQTSEPAQGLVSMRRPREDVTSQSGYYYAIGEAVGDRYEDLVRARIYLNLRAETAEAWMSGVTTALNKYQVPFQFKILRHSGSFCRIDSGVIYVPRRHASLAVRVVGDLRTSLGGLDTATPLFTRRIAPGVALADNPPGGLSFGLSRMRLVAEGLVEAWNSRNSRGADPVKAIAERFRRCGVNPQRPWLNRGNTDIELQRPVGRLCCSSLNISAPWLSVADRLGSRLVRDAIWHRRRCTWIGSSSLYGTDGSISAFGTTGGDLYSGTAGIALFLATLAAATQDERQRATAAGALRQAVDRTRLGRWRIGAYSGLSGVLHASIIVADALQDDEAATRAIPALIRKLHLATPDQNELDIIDGRAGAIRALLFAVKQKLDPTTLALQTAVRFGHDIIRLANRRGDEWSWTTTRSGVVRDLLGYSHGTSGISGALEELFDATGEHEFHDAAMCALRYETAWFDRGQQNWPDFRIREDGTSSGGRMSISGWCHGAPGTALALARHIASNPKAHGALKAMLEAGVNTSVATIVGLPSTPKMESFCLCHGVAGNADILLQIARLNDRRDLPPVVFSAAQEGASRYHDSGAWPCGVPNGGEAPGLLLGLAGIGHFYLRLHDGTVPSPLLL